MDTYIKSDSLMASLQDQAYVKLCAELANCLSISIASARRKVELAAMREGLKDLPSRKKIAEGLIDNARNLDSSDPSATSPQLDELLKAMANEENFMVED